MGTQLLLLPCLLQLLLGPLAPQAIKGKPLFCGTHFQNEVPGSPIKISCGIND